MGEKRTKSLLFCFPFGERRVSRWGKVSKRWDAFQGNERLKRKGGGRNFRLLLVLFSDAGFHFRVISFQSGVWIR